MPFNITAPGTYVLTGNLTAPPATPGIIISTAVAGPVVLDFKGFTITGDSSGRGVLMGVASPTVANTYPITIRNGTIQNGLTGVGTYATGLATYILFTDITVTNMVFNNLSAVGAEAVSLGNAQSSTISNCTFNNCFYGIFDALSPGGNIYINNRFVNTAFAIAVQASGNIGLTLDRCQFAAPPSD